MASIGSDQPCSTAHIAKISEYILNWQELAPYFGLTEADEQEILNNHAYQYKVQKRKMLLKWVTKQGDRATYRELKRVFEEAEERLLVCRVDELLRDAYGSQAPSQAPHNIVNSFQQYLKDCYRSHPATSQGQKGWPPQLSQSPFVKPELVLKPKPQSVAGSKQPNNQQEVNLGDLCKLGKKVMLEGTAGSGKTTLTRHICQQWAEGKLFHDVNLLIHLTLADPALWSAKSLEDIIPYPSAEMRKTVADHIVEQGGKRCCFILDGWEDLPEGSSFIHKLIESKQPGVATLPHCLFIVTSRPVATAFLQPLVSTTVEIIGFKHKIVDTYATRYLTQQVAEHKEEELLMASPTPGTGDTSSILSINDLADVKRLLKNFNDWQSLGLELGLLLPTLKRIKREQHGDINDCMMEMLEAWLQQRDDVAKKGVPSWSTLKAGLMNIDEKKLAASIVIT